MRSNSFGARNGVGNTKGDSNGNRNGKLDSHTHSTNKSEERERERESKSNGHISSRNHGSILIPYNNFRSFHFLFHNRNITPINRILNIYIYIYIHPILLSAASAG